MDKDILISDMGIEERLNRVIHFSQNLIVLSKALYDLSPDAEGAVLSVGNAIKEEVAVILDLYFDEKRRDDLSGQMSPD